MAQKLCVANNCISPFIQQIIIYRQFSLRSKKSTYWSTPLQLKASPQKKQGPHSKCVPQLTINQRGHSQESVLLNTGRLRLSIRLQHVQQRIHNVVRDLRRILRRHLAQHRLQRGTQQRLQIKHLPLVRIRLHIRLQLNDRLQTAQDNNRCLLNSSIAILGTIIY